MDGPGTQPSRRDARIPIGPEHLEGELNIPAGAAGIVLFAHGSGSSRHSPQNQFVARVIRESGNATLLLDLFTPGEEALLGVFAPLRFESVDFNAETQRR